MENAFFEVSMNTMYWRRNLDMQVTGKTIEGRVSIVLLAYE
jgi:hypothetical protein